MQWGRSFQGSTSLQRLVAGFGSRTAPRSTATCLSVMPPVGSGANIAVHDGAQLAADPGDPAAAEAP